jgi:hypothetical protein
MEKLKIIIATLLLLFTTSVFTSCDNDDNVEELAPEITIGQSALNVGYGAGNATIDVTSNVIYFANVNSGSEWLSYEFSDNCKTFNISYKENDAVTERTGIIELSRGEKSVFLTVVQEGNPNAAEPQDTEIEFTIGSAGGGMYSTVMISSAESTKIPVGSTVVFECTGEGSISGAYTGFGMVDVTVADGKAVITWTQEIADAAAGENGFLCMLWGDVTVTRVYIPAEPAEKPTKVDVPFTIGSAGGGMYSTVMISSAESAKIPVGSTVVFECTGEGSISGAYTGFGMVDVTVADGRAVIIWTQEIADAAAGENGFLCMLWGDVSVTRVYYANPKDIVVSEGTAGGGMYKTVLISSEEAAKIPVGSTVVFECMGEGSISGAYTGFDMVDVTVADGKAVIIWTQAIADAVAGESGFLCMLWGDVSVVKSYYY